MANPICCVCHRPIVDGSGHSHHIIPIAYGGPRDGPQVILCGHHHQAIHSLASGLMRKVPHIRRNLFDNEEQLQRALPLASRIVQAAQIAKQDPSIKVARVQVILPHHLHLRLRQRQQDCGFSNLQDFLLAVLTKEANRA